MDWRRDAANGEVVAADRQLGRSGLDSGTIQAAAVICLSIPSHVQQMMMLTGQVPSVKAHEEECKMFKGGCGREEKASSTMDRSGFV